jgi:heat shock protein HtpX
MEMCVDNPREGFSDLFATHPSVEQRIDALKKFAGGHDPGPLAQASPVPDMPAAPAQGPWGQAGAQDAAPAEGEGPWGRHQP